MKSRDLSIAEYLKILQLEYFSCKVRELIYERPEFVKMNKEISEKKKEKILGLGKKFQMLTIFDSNQNAEEFWKEHFVQEFGLPAFQYSYDEAKKKAISYWDKFYLLKTGMTILYNGTEHQVKTNCPEVDSIFIALDKKTKPIPYTYLKIKNLVTRFDGKLM